MLSFFHQFVNSFKKPKGWLLLANVLLVFFLIILSNLKVIPLNAGDFAFFAILGLALALYRPGWAFLFFIGTIMLENINLAPASLGISVRPYQFFGALIILAIIIRLITKRLNFKLAKLEFPDYLVLVMALAGFVSAFGAENKILSLKLSIIFFSFTVLYFLVRNYLQNIEDVKKIIPFFLSSSLIVALYGIWQNIRFASGKINFETMPGRPNATFSEADWLGMFLVLVISIIYILIYYFKNKKITILFSTLIFLYIALIITVSRSAWLAAFASLFFFLFIIFTNLKFNPKKWQWKETIKLKLIIVSALLISFGAVYFFYLTNFKIFERAESIGGEQKITISCGFPSEIHKILKQNSTITIKKLDELEKYDCRHINLEDIEKEKAAGNIIYEIYRPDPNVDIRAEIYQKTWKEIKSHPILGIGWGSIGPILGRDAQGNFYNASNIFLEMWLGSGIFGLLAFVCLLGYILFTAIKNYYFATSLENKVFNLLIIISWFGIVVFNLFNAGILLGFLWVWLAVGQIKK